jgi:hypothetical protein
VSTKIAFAYPQSSRPTPRGVLAVEPVTMMTPRSVFIAAPCAQLRRHRRSRRLRDSHLVQESLMDPRLRDAIAAGLDGRGLRPRFRSFDRVDATVEFLEMGIQFRTQGT